MRWIQCLMPGDVGGMPDETVRADTQTKDDTQTRVDTTTGGIDAVKKGPRVLN